MLQKPNPVFIAEPTQTPTSIILATDSKDPSGVGHHMLALAQSVSQTLAPNLVFTGGRSAMAFVEKAKVLGLRAECIDEKDFANWLARQPGTLLHVHAGIGWEGHTLVAAGHSAGFAVVRTEHLPWLIDQPSERQSYAAMLRGVAQLITVSPGAAYGWQAALSQMTHHAPVTAIPNGVMPPQPRIRATQLRRSLGIDADQPLLLHIGRFTPQKDHATLVQAFALVQQSLPTVQLVMVGDGPLYGAIDAMIKHQGLTGITIVPSLDDIAGMMRASDLFVLPSLFEGMPLVILEAMAARLPVIATRTEGIVDALGSDHPFLVPPKSPSALAKSIVAAFANPAAASNAADRQLRRFQQFFTATEMARATEAVYHRASADRQAKERRPAMQSLTRIGIVGAGGIAQRHLDVLSSFADVAVTAIADPALDRAAAMAAGCGASSHSSVEAMLNDAALDAVFICVPPFAHGPTERAVLAANLPFFVEKPLSADFETAEAISEAVTAAGVITAVGYHWRYLDTLEAARLALGSNVPQLMQGVWLDQTPPPEWWGRQDQSGGQTVEQVTHLVDCLRVLAGGVSTVYAQGNHLPRDSHSNLDVATACSATLTFASGAVASLLSTCLLNWSHRIGLQVFADGLAIELSDQEVMIDVGAGRHPKSATNDPVWREDRDFIDAVRGKPNLIRTNYAEALETHRVAIAITRSMETGEVQRLVPALPQPLPPVGQLRAQMAHPHHHREVRSIGVEAPFRAGIFGYDEAPAVAGQVRLDLCYTGLSAGTELTFLKGTNPYLAASWDADVAMFRADRPAVNYPVQFMGYMEVARISDSRAEGFAPGDLIATTFGHKTGHIANPAQDFLVPMPVDVDPMLGIFVAQMGPIAANGILHADSLTHPDGSAAFGVGVRGQRVAVWGGGTVGLFTALFARAAGAASVIIAEPSEFRRDAARKMGFVALDEEAALAEAKTWGQPGDRGADLVFQTRARSDSLHRAFRALRPQGSVIDLAFYQGGMEDLRLGEEFHHNGLRLSCAQIGRVPHGFKNSWPKMRLSQETLALLAGQGAAIRDTMITHVVPFDEAPKFLSHLINDRPEFLQIVFALNP